MSWSSTSRSRLLAKGVQGVSPATAGTDILAVGQLTGHCAFG